MPERDKDCATSAPDGGTSPRRIGPAGRTAGAGRELARIGLVLLLGMAAAAAAQALAIPLPFVLGPLAVVAICGLADLPVRRVRTIRPLAQVVIGAAIGVQFSGAVLLKTVALLPLIIAASLLAIVVCAGAALILVRLARLDKRTAFFATAPAGAAEMANIAARFGGEAEPITVTQTMRIALTVTVAPFVVRAFADNVIAPPLLKAAVLPWTAVASLIAAAVIGGFVISLSRFPNSWFMGALAGAGLVGATGLVDGRFPDIVINAAQVVIGCSLGAQFRRAFLGRLLPIVVAACASILCALAAMTALAVWCGWAIGIPPPAMALAFAPAGMAEMTLTAKVLGLDATFVSAFHIVRIILVMVLCVPAFRLFERIA